MSALAGCIGWVLLGVLIGLLVGWLAGRLRARDATELRRTTDDIDYSAARAAEFYLAGPESLEIIEGIGPQTARVLRDNGVRTLHTLGSTSVATLQGILVRSGERFRTTNPETWPEQARLATANRWLELRELQHRLFNGLRI